MFSTREIATIIWSIIFIIYALSIKGVRASLVNVFLSFWKLLRHSISFVILCYVCLVFSIMYRLNIIEGQLIKDYIVWIVFALTPLIYKVTSNYISMRVRNLLLDSLKFSIIPLFIINEYTLALWAELILIPVSALIGGLLVVANTDSKYAQVKKLLNVILSLIGIIIFIFAIRGLINNIIDVKQGVFWEKMFLDFLGIILHFPLLFIIQIYSFYEQIIIRTNLNTRNQKFAAYFIIFRRCFFNVKKLIISIQNYNLRTVGSLKELDQELLINVIERFSKKS